MSASISYVQAIADSNCESDTVLPFKKGDIIGVTQTDTGSEGWWAGYLLRDKNAGCRYLHQSLVTPIISYDQPPPPECKYKSVARALYNFSSDHPDDLPVSRGNALLVSPVVGTSEWLEVTRGSQTGLVPSSHSEVPATGETSKALPLETGKSSG